MQAVRVSSERLVMTGKERSVFKSLRLMQNLVEKNPGYLGSKVYRDHDQPSKLVVFSEWSDLGAWNRWLENTDRAEVADALYDNLSGPVIHRVYAPLKEETFLL